MKLTSKYTNYTKAEGENQESDDRPMTSYLCPLRSGFSVFRGFKSSHA